MRLILAVPLEESAKPEYLKAKELQLIESVPTSGAQEYRVMERVAFT